MSQTSVADQPVRAYEGKVHVSGDFPTTIESLLASEIVYFGKAVSIYADNEVALGNQRCKLPTSGDEGPASKNCDPETYALTDGDTFVLDVDNVGDATITFNAAAGYVEDTTTTYPCADQDGLTVVIEVDGGDAQTVTFAGVTTSLASIMAQMNAQLEGVSVQDNGSGQPRITSDTEGTGSVISDPTGTALFVTNSDAPVDGTGDAVNADAVTAAEIETLIEGDSTAVVSVANGVPTIKSPTTGSGSELDFKSGTMLAKLGLSVEVITEPSAGDLAATNFRGVAIADVSREAISDDYGGYAQNDAVSVMRKGRIWVVSEDTVDDLSKGVYVRFQNGSAPPAGTLGSFRATADADCQLMSMLRWIAGETIGGIEYGLLEINLP